MMENQPYQIEWVETIDEEGEVLVEEVDDMEGNSQVDREEYLIGQEIISVEEINGIPTSLDQIAAENLIYMAHDGQVTAMSDLIEDTVERVENTDYNEHQYFECQVTEEVITDDWVQQQGEERVEIPVDQLCGSGGDAQIMEEIDVPIPTDQDEYSALRPYPCDFCSRRFRKKISLTNHISAHRNDRPHICDICGAKYFRKSELLLHFEEHTKNLLHNVPDIEHNFATDHIGAKLQYKTEHYDNDNIDQIIDVKPKVNYGRSGRVVKPKQEVYSQSDHSVESTTPNPERSYNRYSITDPKKPFVCQQCGISFAREKALLSHSRIHEGDSTYECVTCNEMFWDINVLTDHQKTHHFEASNSEYEPGNDEESDSDLDDSKFGEYYCRICGMSFHRQNLLKRHTKKEHGSSVKDYGTVGEIRHCCNVCGETFAEALDLLAHAEIHARFQPIKCTLCGETFLEEAIIKKHVATIHANNMTSNSCKVCGKQCRDARSLMKHAWDHSRERNHSCSKCGKTFHNKTRLRRHMISHRNKSVICDVCKMEFPDGRSLMNHRHSHTNISGKLFPCSECGKTFGSRSSQQIHLRIHTGERPYGCRFCWKAFADGGTLRKHERIHTGEKPYGCSVCPRAFNQRVVLREHIRTHHSTPDPKLGTSQTPYFCTVCYKMFPLSSELIQHLIEHSDTNTALQRQPVAGPRKYKRRRKLKPHELERIRNTKLGPTDAEEDSDEVIVAPLPRRSKTDRPSYSSTEAGRNRKYSAGSDKLNSWPSKLMSPSANDDSYNSVFNSVNIENTLQNIDSLVVNCNSAPSTNNAIIRNKNSPRRRTTKQSDVNSEKTSRPKMIHTQKTRVAVEDGKRKTKTMITRTEPAEINDQVFQQFDGTKPYEKSNCDYGKLTVLNTFSEFQNNPVIVKTEPTSQSDLLAAQLLLDAASMPKEFNILNPDYAVDMNGFFSLPNEIKESTSPQPKSTSPQPKSTSPQSKSTPHQSQQYIPMSLQAEEKEFKEEIKDNAIEELRRSTRSKRSIKSRKYIDFEVSLKSQKSSSSVAIHAPKAKDVSSKIVTVKQEKIEENPSKEYATPIITSTSTQSVKMASKVKGSFQCDMCFAVFSNRSQLLLHVPIHI